MLVRNWFLSVFPLLSFWKAATENGNSNVSIAERDAFSTVKFRWMVAQMNEYWEYRMDRRDLVVKFLHLITVIFNISLNASFLGIASNSQWNPGDREQFGDTGFRYWRGWKWSRAELSNITVSECPHSCGRCQWDKGRCSTDSWDAEPDTCVITLVTWEKDFYWARLVQALERWIFKFGVD